MFRAFRIVTVLFALVLALFFLALANPQPANAQPTTVYAGEYFNNMNFTGPPTLVRDDPQINFDWGAGSPGPGIPADNFSVRWKRWYYIGTAGPYTFTMTTDDGSRLWIDGTLVIDMFYDHAPLTRATTKNLAVGYHLIRMDYYERTGGALAQLTITSGASYPDWKGEYFNNQTLSGSPVVTVNNVAINFNWGTGSPDPAIPVDHFSVRWTRDQYFNIGTYRFGATADDGIRVFVGGALLIDQWHDQPPTTYQNDITITAPGVYHLTVEYYENTGGALVSVNWIQVPTTGGMWAAQYYNNTSFSGVAVLVRTDPNVDFDWGAGSPAPGVNPDNFSAVWNSLQNAPTTGYYTVRVTVDDGVRVSVDGSYIVNAFIDQPPTTYTAPVYLNAGLHSWHVEYYEHTGGAQIHLQILPGIAPPPPSGDIIVDDGSAGWLKGGNPSAWRSAPGYGGHSYWTFNNAFIQPLYNWARWYPSLPQARYYEVFAYIPGGIASTHNARYWVAHGGSYSLVPLAQGFYGNQWLSLGTFYFNAAGGENVSLADVTYECYLCTTVVWDAVKFSPR